MSAIKATPDIASVQNQVFMSLELGERFVPKLFGFREAWKEVEVPVRGGVQERPIHLLQVQCGAYCDLRRQLMCACFSRGAGGAGHGATSLQRQQAQPPEPAALHAPHSASGPCVPAGGRRSAAWPGAARTGALTSTPGCAT